LNAICNLSTEKSLAQPVENRLDYCLTDKPKAAPLLEHHSLGRPLASFLLSPLS
jgi:hypothetical protein